MKTKNEIRKKLMRKQQRPKQYKNKHCELSFSWQTSNSKHIIYFGAIFFGFSLM